MKKDISLIKNGIVIINIIVLSVFVGCGGTGNYEHIDVKEAVLFNEKSFKEVKKISHSIVNNEFIGNPVRITLIDSLLYVVDMSLDSIVHLFDIKNNKYLGLRIGRGHGPGELVTSGYIYPSPDGKFVWVYDLTLRRLVKYNKMNAKKRSVTEVEKIMFTKDMSIRNPRWITDSIFVCTNSDNYKERFLFFDRQLNHKPVYNPLFFFKRNIPDFVLNEIFSALINIKSDMSKIVLAGGYFDCIEIYNSKGELLNVLKGPEEGFTFYYNKQRTENTGRVIKSDDSKRAYIDLVCTNEQIYVLYSGKERRDETGYSNSNIIYSFDWDGNPLTKYELDCQIFSFDVDENSKKIYAIEVMESMIVSFDIN
jgi:hypothetical protein